MDLIKILKKCKNNKINLINICIIIRIKTIIKRIQTKILILTNTNQTILRINMIEISNLMNLMMK